MKRSAALILMMLVAIPMLARPVRRPPLVRSKTTAALNVRKVPDAKAWGRELLAQYHKKQQAGQRGVGTNAIIVNRSARALVIPAAGSAAGSGGTFFRTDLTLVNWNAEDQDLGIIWLPNGNPDGFDAAVVTLPGASPPFTIENMVGTVLGKSGVGSLILLPVVSGGDIFDENAAIDAYSRIWTPQPNATGTVSQPFPGVEPDYMTGEYEAFVLGLRQDPGYRTNYGILNLYDEDITFVVTVFPEDEALPVAETRITVPGASMIQQPIPAGNHGKLSLAVSVDEDVPGDFHTWVTWASSTDNITGDGWVSIGANPYDDDDLDTEGFEP